jgi:phage shock protein C
MLGGVCAGIADYFGFNLRVTRLLAFIAFLVAMPMTLLIYFGVVLLVPSRRADARYDDYDPEFRKALRAEPRKTMSEVRRRFQSMESRLARLERYVTSARFNLDQEFRKL